MTNPTAIGNGGGVHLLSGGGEACGGARRGKIGTEMQGRARGPELCWVARRCGADRGVSVGTRGGTDGGAGTAPRGAEAHDGALLESCEPRYHTVLPCPRKDLPLLPLVSRSRAPRPGGGGARLDRRAPAAASCALP